MDNLGKKVLDLQSVISNLQSQPNSLNNSLADQSSVNKKNDPYPATQFGPYSLTSEVVNFRNSILNNFKLKNLNIFILLRN